MGKFSMGLAGLLLLLASGGLSAVEYSAQVLVADQESEARLVAMRLALQQIITRITGSPEAATPARLGKLWQNPTQIVQEYRYLLLPGLATGSTQRLLEVRFDPAALDQSLQSAQVSVWQQRPVVLLWLVELQAGRQVLLGDQDARVQALLAQVRAERGLEVLLPLGDAEDQRSLPLSDLWGGFVETIRSASARYGAQVILVGRLAPRLEGGWQGRWLLLGEPDTEIAWDSPAPDATQGLTAGLTESWARLWRNFGPDAASATEQTQTVQVGGLRQASDYAQTLAALRGAQGIRSLRISQLNLDVLTLSVRYRGSPEDLRQTLLLGGRFHPQGSDSRAAVWHYQWR